MTYEQALGQTGPVVAPKEKEHGPSPALSSPVAIPFSFPLLGGAESVAQESHTLSAGTTIFQ